MTNGRVCRLTAQGWARMTEVPDAPVLKVPIGKILTALDESGSQRATAFQTCVRPGRISESHIWVYV